MALQEATKRLLSDIEKLDVLDSRYTNLKCVSIANEKRRGVLSLVFKAHDSIEGRDVAIKFMDPNLISNTYRMACFDREPEIVKSLSGTRCLNLVQKKKNFSWKLPVADNGSTPILIPVGYFVVDWIEEDIDDYFFNHSNTSSYERLLAFKLIVLSVQAIHSHGVHHRDLKRDNLRQYVEAERVVVVIDFGTAARLDTKKVGNDEDYGAPVGAPAYAAPEARFFSLAGCRTVAPLNDFYSLGCILYELFNENSLFFEVLCQNPDLEAIAFYINTLLSTATSDNERLEILKVELSKYEHLLKTPSILSGEHDLPASVASIVERLHQRLCNFNLFKREGDFQEVIKQLDRALKVINNQKAEEINKKKRDLYRKNRLRKIAKREEKFRKYIEQTREELC